MLPMPPPKAESWPTIPHWVPQVEILVSLYPTQTVVPRLCKLELNLWAFTSLTYPWHGEEVEGQYIVDRHGLTSPSQVNQREPPHNQDETYYLRQNVSCDDGTRGDMFQCYSNYCQSSVLQLLLTMWKMTEKKRDSSSRASLLISPKLRCGPQICKAVARGCGYL